jgi:hypothetical protein
MARIPRKEATRQLEDLRIVVPSVVNLDAQRECLRRELAVRELEVMPV